MDASHQWLRYVTRSSARRLVGSSPLAARHCYCGMGMRDSAGDGARRMSARRHVPAKRRLIMTEHHEVRSLRQAGQQ